jgi:hypothetical protein
MDANNGTAHNIMVVYNVDATLLQGGFAAPSGITEDVADEKDFVKSAIN